VYQYGKGCSEDFGKAVKYYKLAADQGHPDAEYFMGYMFEYGRGVANNKDEAVRWYTLAMQHGNEDAKIALKRLAINNAYK